MPEQIFTKLVNESLFNVKIKDGDISTIVPMHKVYISANKPFSNLFLENEVVTCVVIKEEENGQ